MARVTSTYIGRLMVEAGIMTEEQFHNCTRIVLDAPANGLPQIYIVLMADEDFLAKLAPIMEPLMEQTEDWRDSGIGETGIRDGQPGGGGDSDPGDEAGSRKEESGHHDG